MSNPDIDVLCAEWLKAKEQEEGAKAKRREIEDVIKELLNIDENADDTLLFSESGFDITVATRVNYKVDSNRLRELAREHGLTRHLSKFFSHKYALICKNWKMADERYTSTLSDAIKMTVARASFKISRDSN